MTGSGTPPKLWIKVPPQVMEEEKEENTEGREDKPFGKMIGERAS